MKSGFIRIVVLIGSLSIAGILVFQYFWVSKAYQLGKNDLDKTIGLALYNVANKLASYNNSFLAGKDPVVQKSENYYIVDVNSEIDEHILSYYLKTEFEFRNFEIPYVYAIYDCHNEDMRICNANDLTKQLGIVEYCEEITTDSDLTYYFGIYFPTKSQYIIGEIRVWIILTIVLFIAMFFFSSAIFIILRQKKLSEIQSEFINNLTHEFKTPISTIGISTDVLLQDEILTQPERLKTYVQIIKEENQRMEAQVEKILQLAVLDKNQFKSNKIRFDIVEQLSIIVSSFQVRLKNSNGNCECILPENKLMLLADKIHFTNMIYSLLDNAMKYSKENPEICLELKTEINSVLICIKDNGIGIPKDFHRKIFDNFYRVSTGNLHDVKGFGIGLAYVRKVVKMHDWKVWVESELNTGSVFCIEIPNSQIEKG